MTVMNAARPAPSGVTELTPRESIEVDNWLDYARAGHRVGGKHAPIVLVLFSDFECPYCRKFAEGGFQTLRARYGDSVAIVFRHFPLPNHKMARHFAKASICADEAGRFEAFHDAVFAGQDSLGLKSVSQFAKEAGIEDVDAFSTCLTRQQLDTLVDLDLEVATSLKLTGTPTLIIDGKVHLGALDGDDLLALVEPVFRRSFK
jgi:protein-disulfide isomerase